MLIPKKLTTNSKKKKILPDPEKESIKILRNKASAGRREWLVREMAQKQGSIKPKKTYESRKKYREWSPSQEWPVILECTRTYKNPPQNPHRNNQYHNDGFKFPQKSGCMKGEAS